jgi:hypothetical protein
MDTIKQLALILAALCITCSCSKGASQEFAVSARFPICVNLKEYRGSTPRIANAHDFEVTRINTGQINGNIYIGDFPDFPKFSPDEKHYEPAGAVTFIGSSKRATFDQRMFRFGLASEPSVYVLFSFYHGHAPDFFTAMDNASVVAKCILAST